MSVQHIQFDKTGTHVVFDCDHFDCGLCEEQHSPIDGVAGYMETIWAMVEMGWHMAFGLRARILCPDHKPTGD